MTEINKNTFWTLIDQAKAEGRYNPSDSANWLAVQLAAMGPEQAKRFDTIAHVYMDAAYQYGLWTAASVMERHGCSDDGFIDFRGWLIGQGREVYMAALKDPDSLADAPPYQDFQFDDLAYMGRFAYEQLLGRDIYQDFSSDLYRTLTAEITPDIVYGKGIGYPYTWSEAAAYLPRLCAKYLTPEELDRRIRLHNDTWNVSCPTIKLARATARQSKKIKKDRGDAR